MKQYIGTKDYVDLSWNYVHILFTGKGPKVGIVFATSVLVSEWVAAQAYLVVWGNLTTFLLLGQIISTVTVFHCEYTDFFPVYCNLSSVTCIK